MISILIFTLYIILLFNTQLGKFFGYLDLSRTITEVLEQQRGVTLALNVVAIRDQRHANGSKQRTLLADVDVPTPQGVV